MEFDVVQTLDCDVAVIGGGGAGMVAAARSASFGHSVVVLEKTAHTGGGAKFASAIRTFRSKWQQERNLPDQMEEFIREGMDATDWKLDPKLVRSACEGTGQFFDWFCREAPETLDQFEVGTYVFDGPNGPKVPLLKGSRSHYGSGKVIMEKMLEICQKNQVQVLTNCPAVDVEVEQGRISAVIAKSPQGYLRVNCRVCMLMPGSWISAPEVVKQVCPEFLDAELDVSCYAHCPPNCSGDGIPMAEKVGALVDRDQFCLRLMGPCVLNPSQVLSSMGDSGYQINVNLNGKRWSAEPIQRRMGLFRGGHVLVHQPKGLTYAIFDEDNLTAAFQRSKEENNGYEGFFGGLHFPDTMEETHADIDAILAKKDGSAFRANTLTELAQQIGLPEDALSETVSQYNAACASGNDLFFKDPKEMVALNRAPYYAVRGRLGSDGAFGGVLVNEHMQAYRVAGGCVDGLYVAGDFAGGRHIKKGDFKEQVLNDCSWAFSGGFLAAEHAHQWLAELDQETAK